MLDDLRRPGSRVRMLFLDASTDVLIRRYESTRRRHPAERRRPARRGHRAGAPDARAAAGRGRRGGRHQRPQRPPAPRPHRRAVRRRRPGAGHAGHGHVVRVQARPARATSTWCSTAGSCPTRTGSTSSARRPASTSRCATTCSAPSWPRRSSTGSTACSTCCCPAFQAEGKAYLTLAFGCTGGRHRSVAIAEEVARRLRGAGPGTRACRTATSPRAVSPVRRAGARRSSPSAAATAWPRRCGPSGRYAGSHHRGRVGGRRRRLVAAGCARPCRRCRRRATCAAASAPSPRTDSPLGRDPRAPLRRRRARRATPSATCCSPR